MNFKISIPQPCHEDWSKMTSVERGRFCNACQKVVTDFTWMSDAEIIQHLKTSSANSCGRFNANQVNRNLIEPTPQKSLWFSLPKFSAAASIIFSLLQLPVFAQTKKQIKVEQVEIKKHELKPIIIRAERPLIILEDSTHKPSHFNLTDWCMGVPIRDISSTLVTRGVPTEAKPQTPLIPITKIDFENLELKTKQTRWQRFKRKLKKIF
jgi:hypothetical protein